MPLRIIATSIQGEGACTVLFSAFDSYARRILDESESDATFEPASHGSDFVDSYAVSASAQSANVNFITSRSDRRHISLGQLRRQCAG